MPRAEPDENCSRHGWPRPFKEGGERPRTSPSEVKPGAVDQVPQSQGGGGARASAKFAQSVRCEKCEVPKGRAAHNDSNRYSFAPQTDSAEIESPKPSATVDSEASLSRHQETGVCLSCVRTLASAHATHFQRQKNIPRDEGRPPVCAHSKVFLQDHFRTDPSFLQRHRTVMPTRTIEPSFVETLQANPLKTAVEFYAARLPLHDKAVAFLVDEFKLSVEQAEGRCTSS